MILIEKLNQINTLLLNVKSSGRKWVEIRREILKFFNYTCQKCKVSFTIKEVLVPYRKRVLEIHHIIPKFYNGQNSFQNFTCLCRKCHKIETRKINLIQNQIRKKKRKERSLKNQKRIDKI